MTRLILDKQAIGVNTPDTQHIMLLVLAALLPGTAAYAYIISPIVLINICVAIVLALALEFLAVRMRRANGTHAIQDGSICVAAYLLALALPPAIPFWQLSIGVLFMVMLGKHVYGGLGHNPFNPAMVGYAVLMISFPQNMTLWFAPNELLNVGIAALVDAKLGFAQSIAPAQALWDGITQATPLEHVRSLQLQSIDIDENQVKNAVAESGWVWINLAFLFGGIFLLAKKVIQWHIPVAVLASYCALSLFLAESHLPLHYSVLSGALIIGAFFIATDPVTTASSKPGRLVFGAGVGTLTFVIREYGGYPEGLAFAILLMNLCVPLLDHLDMRMR